MSDYGAFYCDQGDFMAYDDGAQGVLAKLADAFGPSVVAVVLAHEFGHAIQGRTGDLDRNEPTVYTEQQADCFSGAWSAHVWRGEAPTVSFTDEDVRTAMIALVRVRDPLGTSVYDDGGHGSAFDRIGAFQTGFIGGATDCKDLIDHPLPLLPNQFKPRSGDEMTEGDAPFDKIIVIVQGDLNTFWPAQLAALGRGTMPTITARTISDPSSDNCGEESALKKEVAIYCAASRQVLVDAVQARTLYDDFGDFAVGFVVGRAWAEAAQEALGSTLAGETRSLIDDCLVGGWVTGAIDWADSGPSAPSIPTLPGLARPDGDDVARRPRRGGADGARARRRDDERERRGQRLRAGRLAAHRRVRHRRHLRQPHHDLRTLRPGRGSERFVSRVRALTGHGCLL